jgi:integrase
MSVDHSKRRVRIERGLYQRPSDGKYEAGYTCEGKWTMVTLRATSLTEARKEQRALVTKVDSGEAVASNRITLGTVRDELLADTQRKIDRGQKQQRTKDALNARLRAAFKKLPASTPIQKLTPRTIIEADLTFAEYSGLHRLLSFAFEEPRRYIYEHPCARIPKDDRPRCGKATIVVLDNEALGKLLGKAEGQWRVLFSLMAYSGLRPMEALGLRWGDLADGFIHVRGQLTRTGSYKPTPKTDAGNRAVVLVPQLAALLRRHRLASRYSADTDFIFQTGHGTALDYGNARRALKAAGGTNCKLFRHTFASHLILDLKLDVVQVSRQLGHARPSITLDIYSHLFDQARHAEDIRDRLADSDFAAVLS